MNKNDLLYIFHDPNSAWGLRHRASRLEDCDYKLFLQKIADALEEKKLNKRDARKLIEYWRSGNEHLISVAIKVLANALKEKEGGL
jgi:hypothetical protein